MQFSKQQARGVAGSLGDSHTGVKCYHQLSYCIQPTRAILSICSRLSSRCHGDSTSNRAGWKHRWVCPASTTPCSKKSGTLSIFWI